MEHNRISSFNWVLLNAIQPYIKTKSAFPSRQLLQLSHQDTGVWAGC